LYRILYRSFRPNGANDEFQFPAMKIFVLISGTFPSLVPLWSSKLPELVMHYLPQLKFSKTELRMLPRTVARLTDERTIRLRAAQ
jgi:hypothetical protein